MSANDDAAIFAEIERGISLHRAGRLAEAAAVYSEVLSRRPKASRALQLLGTLKFQAGDRKAGIELLRQATAADSSNASAHSDLGALLSLNGEHRQAIDAFERSISLQPGWAEAHNNLGVAFEKFGDLSSAQTAYRRAIQLRYTYPEAHHHLGNALRLSGRAIEAIAEHRIAVALKPDYSQAYSGLAQAFSEVGDQARAIECYRTLVKLQPDNPVWGSDLLFALQHVDESSPGELFAEHLAWAQRLSGKGREAQAFQRRPRSNNKLRIGYVSPDFRSHPTALMMEPLLTHHDRRQFEIFCYADVARPDAATERLRSLGCNWRDVSLQTPADVAAQIEADELDVLIDLAVHCGNRLSPLLAAKLAPVQATYYGYLNTTGLRTVDCRITDATMDPPGQTERWHTEKLVRLERCAWCYRPHSISPPVSAPRSSRLGFITFGCLNRAMKVSRAAADLWIQILRAVPDARMVVVGPQDGMLPVTLSAAIAGDASVAARVRAVGRRTLNEYLALFSDIDVSLDPFPHNGGATTLDSLWMGVPVVTLAGRTAVGRIGASLLNAAGLDKLVVETPEQYVKTAVALASDLASVAALRGALRGRLQASAICDERGFVARFEVALRDMHHSRLGS